MDARMLVLAGLEGGKGVPESIADHPVVFATLTAPSFGAVHRSLAKGGRHLVCRPGKASRCIHGRTRFCNVVHREGEAIVGEPICLDCYDYERAVLFNALAPELWRRVTIYSRRNLAKLYGLTQQGFNARVRLSFIKVVEYQRRGVIHFHAVARLDPIEGAGPLELNGKYLATAIEMAASQVSAPYPGGRGIARFGEQINLQTIEGDGASSRRGVAGYVAKYATKSSDDDGVLDRKIRSEVDLEFRNLTLHLRRLAETAWRLGKDPAYGDLPLRPWAHTLGFRGHWMTKSRQWSTTFKFLRAERARWQDDRRKRLAGNSVFGEVPKRYEFVGIGWRNAGEEYFAATKQREMFEVRVMLREVEFRS